MVRVSELCVLVDGTGGGSGSGNGARATRFSLAMRFNVGSASQIAASCERGSGAGEAAFVDTPVAACRKRPDQMPGAAATVDCIDGETDFIDVNLPIFHPLAPGETPPALNNAGGVALTGVNQDASGGARSSVVRLGDLTTRGEFGGFDCAAVRGAAFPQ